MTSWTQTDVENELGVLRTPPKHLPTTSHDGTWVTQVSVTSRPTASRPAIHFTPYIFSKRLPSVAINIADCGTRKNDQICMFMTQEKANNYKYPANLANICSFFNKFYEKSIYRTFHINIVRDLPPVFHSIRSIRRVGFRRFLRRLKVFTRCFQTT